ITNMLERPCEVIQATNGRDAIQKAAILKPDIVFMDIRMPGIDGLNALKAIKNSQPNVKMVLVTAYEYFDYAKEAIHRGVKDYIIKPAKRNDIMSLLEKLIDQLDEEQMENQLHADNVYKLTQFTLLAKTELALSFMSEQLSEEAIVQLADLVQIPLQHCCAMVIARPDTKDKVKAIEQAINQTIEKSINDASITSYQFVTSTILNN